MTEGVSGVMHGADLDLWRRSFESMWSNTCCLAALRCPRRLTHFSIVCCSSLYPHAERPNSPLFIALTPSSRLLTSPCLQPKEVKDIKEFLTLSKRADAKSVKIKKGKGKNGVTKFKIRCSRVSAFPSCDNALCR